MRRVGEMLVEKDIENRSIPSKGRDKATCKQGAQPTRRLGHAKNPRSFSQPLTHPAEKLGVSQSLGTDQVQDTYGLSRERDGPFDGGEHVVLGNWLDADRTTAQEGNQGSHSHLT